METTLNDYKLSCELFGHSLDVRAVAAGGSTDNGGQFILSGSRDKTTKMWKPNGNEYVDSVTFQDHKNFLSYVYYHSAEQWICTASNDATICIYKPDGYVPILTLKGHESTVCCIASGVQPQSIISGSWDKTARVWTINQLGSYTHVSLVGHEAAVWAVASLPSQQKFITGGADKCIYYWNVKGERLRLLQGHTDCVRGLLTFADNTFISCGNDSVIRYWNEDGECEKELNGHANYIYTIAQNKALGEHVVASCGEDSTLRLWNIVKGVELGEPIFHPAVSVWSVACLDNGDIVTGSSDGIVRVFTKDPTRVAKPEILEAFQMAVNSRRMQMNEEIGGIKKTDLPGPESLLTNGTREGQTKMVRHPDGSVKCYSWELGSWKLVGDVTGATGGSQETSGKQLFEGKEYDFVFSVDISDTDPPIKLPYNRGEDPWVSAQAFIHRNNLPQAYLDQVANFIIKNSAAGPVVTQSTSSGYVDPFTGGARYVPGSSNANIQNTGNVDPFTGGSSYSTSSNLTKGNFDKHFPVSTYITVDNCDLQKVINKLAEFNSHMENPLMKVPEVVLESIMKLSENNTSPDIDVIEAFVQLLKWPSAKLFPVIDVLRLAVRNESTFIVLHTKHKFLDLILPQLESSAPNQLMIVRCLANIMNHAAGRQEVGRLLSQLILRINNIRDGSANLQIAIATFYLNVTIAETLNVAEANTCQMVTMGVIEFFKWVQDLEASYRLMQAIGNLTTTPHGQVTSALIISSEYVMDKIRELTNISHTGTYAKLNSVAQELLAAF